MSDDQVGPQTKSVVDEWPTDVTITFVSFEVGADVHVGGVLPRSALPTRALTPPFINLDPPSLSPFLPLPPHSFRRWADLIHLISLLILSSTPDNYSSLSHLMLCSCLAANRGYTHIIHRTAYM